MELEEIWDELKPFAWDLLAGVSEGLMMNVEGIQVGEIRQGRHPMFRDYMANVYSKKRPDRRLFMIYCSVSQAPGRMPGLELGAKNYTLRMVQGTHLGSVNVAIDTYDLEGTKEYLKREGDRLVEALLAELEVKIKESIAGPKEWSP